MSDPRPLRVVYLGNDRWSAPALSALASSDHDVVLVVTRVPRPGRRGGSDVPTPVASEARRLALPLVETDTVRAGAGLRAIADARGDVLAVVAYGELLPAAVLRLASVAPVNVHFSLLPELRGASPVQTALLRGLTRTGVTAIVMDEGLDTGDVLAQTPEPIRAGDDAGSLGDRLARLGAGLLVETLDRLANGTAHGTPQDHDRATYAPKLSARDRRLDWTEPAATLANVVRAMSPAPGATATFRGEPVKILRVRPVDGSGLAGEVLEVDRRGFSVGAGEGALRIEELAPAGRSRMPASSFVNGFHPLVGERWS